MNCKNCNSSLRTDFAYCPGCGAKIEVRRITIRSLIGDLADRVFNLDSTFFRTFRDLLLRPESVITGYISGIRKKYLNPLSYMAVALTLSGLTLYLIQKFFKDQVDFTRAAGNVNPAFTEKWSNIVFDLNAFLFLLYLPMLALPSYLLLNRVRYNFAEHIVAFVYIMAHFSIVSFPVALAILLFSPDHYVDFSQPLLIVTFLYSIYVLQRMNRYKPGQLIGRSLGFLALALILFFVLIVAILVVLIISGVFSLEDFRPVETTQAISSSAMNWASYSLW